MSPATVKTLATLLAQMLVADLRRPSRPGSHARSPQPSPELTMPNPHGRDPDTHRAGFTSTPSAATDAGSESDG